MNYLKLCCLLFFFYSSNVFAQTRVSGTVLDDKGTIIPYANVLLTQKGNSSFYKGTITDENGNFELETPQKGSYILDISYVGFFNWKKLIVVEKNISVNLAEIVLKVSETILDEIKITSKKIIENKNGTLIFNVDKSPMKNGYTGIELLKNSPNIFIGIDDAILIRNEEVTLLINGVKSNLSGIELTNYVANLQSENIKSIVLQSNSSVNTDAENSGGIINIILKKPTKGYTSNISTNYTFKEKGYNDFFIGTSISYGAKLWNVYGSYNFSNMMRLDNINRNYDYFTKEKLVLTSIINEGLKHKKQNYQLSIILDASKKDVFGIEFFATNYKNPYIESGKTQILNNNTIYENGNLLFKNRTENNLYNTAFTYTRKLDSLLSDFKIITTYLKQNLSNDSKTASTYNQGIYKGSETKNNSKAKTIVLSNELALEKNIKHHLKIKSGIKYTITKRLNNLTSSDINIDETNTNETAYSFNYTERLFAGYLSLNTKRNRFFIDIGMRFEKTNVKTADLLVKNIKNTKTKEYSNWFPAGYLSYDFSKGNSISFGYSKKIKRPYFRNLTNYVLKVNDFSYAIGNPNLESENIDKYELNFKRKKQRFSIYYSNIANSIVSYYYNEADIIYHQYINGGKKQELGLEYNYTSNLFYWWYINGVTGVFQRKFTDDTKQHIFDWTTAGTFKLTNIFKLNRTTGIDISGYYISSYKYDYNTQYNYKAINVVFKKLFLKDKLTTKIYCNDIFNMLNYENKTNLVNVNREFTNKPLTQTIKFSLSYRFSGRKNIKRKSTFKNEIRNRL